jgi:antitoxin component YwqK of YwqJK toxin-antitoxin module
MDSEVNPSFIKKKKMVRFIVFIGIIVLSVLGVKIIRGIHHFKSDEIRVVKAKYEEGMDKEVWLYKRNIFGKKKKIKEIVYFKNGNKENEIDYKYGKVNGRARMWYENGRLRVEATYKDNKTHGVRIAYHKNGKVFCRAEYDEGKLLRKKNWDEEGNEIYLPVDRE